MGKNPTKKPASNIKNISLKPRLSEDSVKSEDYPNKFGVSKHRSDAMALKCKHCGAVYGPDQAIGFACSTCYHEKFDTVFDLDKELASSQ